MTAFPVRQAVRPADAIVVLGGGGPRLATALRYQREGYAWQVYLSVDHLSPGGRCPPSSQGVRIPRHLAGVTCFVPDPFTTRGEARFVARLARSGDEGRFIVITSTPQMDRARLRIQRCTSAATTIVGVRPGAGVGPWVGSVTYELGAYLKATIQRSC